jgi:hypothetical protein
MVLLMTLHRFLHPTLRQPFTLSFINRLLYPDVISIITVVVTGLTHYLGQDSDAEEMKSESKDFVLVAGTYILLIPSDVCCVLCAVGCVMFAVYCVLCAVCCVLCDVWCVLCAVCCVLSDVCCLMCAVGCVLCDVCYLMFNV